MALPLGMALGAIIGHVISSLIFRVIASFGVGIVVWSGVSAMLDGVLGQVQSLTAGLPLAVSQAVILMRIDDGISVVFGAMAIRISLKSFGVGGNIGQMIVKGNQPGA